MSNACYLTKLRATIKTQAPRSNGRTKFWSRMFLASAFLAAAPLQISAVHSSVRPAQTLWNTDTSNIVLSVFNEKAAKITAPELVQVADRGGKIGVKYGKKDGKYGKKDGKGGTHNKPDKPPYCPPEPEPKQKPKPTPRSNPCDGADNCGSERRTKNVKPVVEDTIVSVHG